MKILTNSQFNQLTQNRNREDGRSFGNISGDLPIADYVMTVEITADWTQQSGGGYTALARQVAFDDGAFSLEGGEFPIWNPMFSSEKPSNAVGDRMAVCWRGRWEVIGGGGEENPIIQDILTSTLLPQSNLQGNIGATTEKGYTVWSPTMMPARAVATGTTIIHNGDIILDFTAYADLLAFPLVAGTVTNNNTANAIFTAPLPSWLDTWNAEIEYTLVSPQNAWTNIGLPPQTIAPTYPCWIYARYANAANQAIQGPIAMHSINPIAGSLIDTNVPVGSTLVTGGRPGLFLSAGNWINSITTTQRQNYRFQYYISSLATAPSNSSWIDMTAQSNFEVTISAVGNPGQGNSSFYLWTRVEMIRAFQTINSVSNLVTNIVGTTNMGQFHRV